MTTAADIMRLAGVLLHDQEHERWTPSELRDWINDGLKQIALVKPSAKSGTRVLSLVEGTLQTVAAAAGAPVPLALLDIVCNVTSEGPTVRGRAIKVTSRKVLDSADPDWHIDARTRFKKEVRQFCYDEQAPLEFYVYPGNDGTGKVEALCAEMPTLIEVSATPDDATSYTDTIDLPETYDPALVDYVCYRAQSEDSTDAVGGKASEHFAKFANAIGMKITVEGASSPNNRRARA